jgi:hypothetical protein
MRAQLRNDPVDAAIAAIAARQHGVIARIQLLRMGLGRRAIAHRIEQGRLHIVQRGVYAVGHARLTVHGRWMAAVLASGEGSRLSYRSGAMLWSIRRTERGLIEVTSETVRASVFEAEATVVMSVGESVSEVDFEAA